MFEELFFSTGVLNNLFLILIFSVRKLGAIEAVKRIGWAYLGTLGVLGVACLGAGVGIGADARYIVFLSIFLLYLALELVYDYILKVNFRRDWKLLAPYLCLYYAMHYGFVVMVWKNAIWAGVVMLILFMVQLGANLLSHKERQRT